LPGDGSRIPWLTKQADANALNLAPEGGRINTCETERNTSDVEDMSDLHNLK